MDEDLVLLDRILTGDAKAFEELIHRHEQRIYRVAMGIIGNHEDAEEAIQQTFLKVYQHLGGFQRSSKFTTWMTRIAINEALQILRRRRPTVSLDDPQVSDEGVTTETTNSPTTRKLIRSMTVKMSIVLSSSCRYPHSASTFAGLVRQN